MVKAKQAAYVKDDFFDMMSCETLDKMGHAQGGDGPHHRRSVQVREGQAGGLACLKPSGRCIHMVGPRSRAAHRVDAATARLPSLMVVLCCALAACLLSQRAVDIETFGGLGGVRHFHHRGRGRGRGGRGGYGRQGGGGLGFYNNPQGGRGGPRQ